MDLDIIKYYIQNKMYYKLIRTPEVQQKYMEHIKSLDIDINANIKEKYLKHKRYALTENAFPYNVKEGIKHYIFWYLDNLDIETVIIILKNEFELNNFYIFENTIEYKTVKNIPHYHVFFCV